MHTYSVVMFAVALIFLVLGILIRRGHIGLIHSCHAARVKDRTGYGKAFGRTILWMAGATLASGLLSLVGESDEIALASAALLMAGVAAGIALLLRVQKKFGGLC